MENLKSRKIGFARTPTTFIVEEGSIPNLPLSEEVIDAGNIQITTDNSGSLITVFGSSKLCNVLPEQRNMTTDILRVWFGPAATIVGSVAGDGFFNRERS